eukprot:Awhi_evm1s12989
MDEDDMSYVAHKLATYITKPGHKHMRAAVRALQYMYNARHYGIAYSSREGVADKITVHADGSLADLDGANPNRNRSSMY